MPGPARGPFKVRLADRSLVTYSWYRFIDQPCFFQFGWDSGTKAALQAMVEKIPARWPIDRPYMPPPSALFAALASLDQALIVMPPAGLEVGYVPIVIRQESDSVTNITQRNRAFPGGPRLFGGGKIHHLPRSRLQHGNRGSPRPPRNPDVPDVGSGPRTSRPAADSHRILIQAFARFSDARTAYSPPSFRNGPELVDFRAIYAAAGPDSARFVKFPPLSSSIG